MDTHVLVGLFRRICDPAIPSFAQFEDTMMSDLAPEARHNLAPGASRGAGNAPKDPTAPPEAARPGNNV